MKTLKTLEQCSWEDIEIGEVFAFYGCWNVGYKSTSYSFISLAKDWLSFMGVEGREFSLIEQETEFYKLPQSVQKLWRCDL